MGAGTFGWGALCALLESGTYDAYFVPGFTNGKKEDLIADGLMADSVKRLVGVPIEYSASVNAANRLVLVAFGPELRTLATSRQKLKRYDAPVCGVIHSVNSERIVFAILQQHFAGLCEADLLLCSSRAGMRTIEVYIEEIGHLLLPNTPYRARRVLVPLGLKIPALERQDRVNLRRRLNIRSKETIAMFFGRLSQTSKGDLGPLLVALSLLIQQGVDIHLVIAGDDTQMNETPRLTALASELGCVRSLTIWANPSASDKHLLYSGADIFVSPSDNIQETYGLTVAEALSYGLPAVVSDWDGYRDIVNDGKTGFLVPSLFPPTIASLLLSDCTTSMTEEDPLAESTTVDITALCDRLQKLVQDPALRERMGRSARQHAEESWSWPVIIRRYEELWEESVQMAKAAHGDRPLTSPVLSLSLEKSFGHFATAKRSLGCECSITAEGLEWLKRPARLYFLCHLYGPP